MITGYETGLEPVLFLTRTGVTDFYGLCTPNDRHCSCDDDLIPCRDYSVTRLGNFSKPLAAINLPKSLTFLDNFCKMLQSLIFGQLL